MWNLSMFRSALDYYLNDNFNLNKIMIFVKAYTHFYKSRASNNKGPNLMEDHSDLVDMKSLFSSGMGSCNSKRQRPCNMIGKRKYRET